MQHDVRKYLTDIAIQINHIDAFLQHSRDFAIYDADLIVQYAVERALGIIGEAANQVRKMEPGIPISSLHQIISLRNILIHAYDGVNNTIIWSIIINHLPTLQIEVNALLSQLDTETKPDK
ncbi:HepT-like ribonuclease domain-containing protein [Spirosoma panaciterrae]|uniref:HepT-like ribonuclease domain-containing protein n=1 Tax=Spirosoma panaciterrae TaxID=496058 RepID=UPI00037D068A|nr:HepT-like ribonuclease domain-containing protein [Spirosoma panaciterrae]